MLHFSLPRFIVVVSVTFLCQKVGVEKTGRPMFFAIPISLIQLYRKRKRFIYDCCSRKNVRDDKWGRGRRTHFERAETQIRLGISERARVWVIPLFLHHPRDATAPSCSPFSVLTKYGRFHTSWIWLHIAAGSAQLPKLHSHTDHQVTSVLCVYSSSSSSIDLCLSRLLWSSDACALKDPGYKWQDNPFWQQQTLGSDWSKVLLS